MVAPRKGRVNVAGAVAAIFSQSRYGIAITTRDRGDVTIGITPTQLVENNPKRVHWLAMNRSVNNGSAGSDLQITFANGFLVAANGGLISLDVLEDGEVVAHPFFAINDSASGIWRVWEIVGV